MLDPSRSRSLALALVLSLGLPLLPSAGDAKITPAFDPLQSEAAFAPTTIGALKTLGRSKVAPGKALVTTTFPTSKIVKGPGTPAGTIVFVPFKPVDAKGNPVDPSATITDIYDHNAQVNAGQYWTAVNAYEQRLNTRGYTLRVPTKVWDPGRVVGATQPEYLGTVHAKLLSGSPALSPTGNNFAIVQKRTKLGLIPATDAVVQAGSKALVVVPYTGPPKPAQAPISGPKPTPTPSPKPTLNPNAYKNIPSAPPHGVKNPNAPCTASPGSIGHNNLSCPSFAPYTGPTESPLQQVEAGILSAASAGYSTAPPNAIAYGNFFYPLGIKDPGANYAPLVPQPQSVASDTDTVTALDFPWSSEWGDPSLADFYANADINSSADLSKAMLTTSAQAAAGAHVLSIGGDILSANMSLTGNQGHIDVELVGISVYTKGGTTSIADSTSASNTFVNISVPIPILFFDVIISGSVSGSMTLGYQVQLTSLVATGSATLNLQLNAIFTANVGIDFGVGSISAGVYGSLNVANVTFPFGVSAGFTVLNTMNGQLRTPKNIVGCQLAYFHDMTLDLNYALLSGSFGVDAQACIIFLGCDTATLPIVNWSGSTGSVPIISDPGGSNQFSATPIGTVFSDLPEYGVPLPTGAVFSQDDASGMPGICDVLNAAEST